MAAIITEKFRLHNADQFKESFTEASASNYYLFVGKSSPFSATTKYSDQETTGGTDASPPNPHDRVIEENYKWDSMLAAKKITSTDVMPVIPRRNYSQVTFDMYEHDITATNATTSGASNIYDSTFYFVTDAYRVYKVLDNNGGAVISDSNAPTSTSSAPFFHGGYYLQYMYTLQTADTIKFLTTDFLAVRNDATVTTDVTTASGDSAPFNGAPIQVVRVTAVGSGLANGDYYTKVNGDGTGAIVKIKVSGNAIEAFGENGTLMHAGGSGYTFGTIDLTKCHSTSALNSSPAINLSGGSAAVHPIISPRIGHGHDPVSELGGHYVMMNARLEQTESGDFTVANDFREVGIVVDPYNAGTTTVSNVSQVRMTHAIKIDTTSGDFEVDEKITQASTDATGRVVEWDATKKVLYYIQEQWENYGISSDSSNSAYQTKVAFSGGNNITGASSSKVATVKTGATGADDAAANSGNAAMASGITFTSGYALPELEHDSGNIIYVENRRPISRASDQTEDIKIVIEF
tara:strand:+ start:7649 stop:9208 length:1560 start_codon:yes stop_codon:yes gene_type:complete